MTPALRHLARLLAWSTYDHWPFPGPPWRVQPAAAGRGWRQACAVLALAEHAGGWWVVTEQTYDLAEHIANPAP